MKKIIPKIHKLSKKLSKTDNSSNIAELKKDVLKIYKKLVFLEIQRQGGQKEKKRFLKSELKKTITANHKIKDIKPQAEETLDDIISAFDSEPVFIKKQGNAVTSIIEDNNQDGQTEKIINVLFNGVQSDYLRVISQIKEFDTYEKACVFINQHIKPEYGNWKEKETIEVLFFKNVQDLFSTLN